MKTLFLHIGTHKTGTTAFQSLLKEKKKQLFKKDGLAVINLTKFPKLQEFKLSEEFDKDLVSELRLFIEQHAVCNKNILSYEGLSGKTEKVVYSNTGTLAKMLRSATQSFDTKILVLLRRQDEFIQSLYTQKIHQGLIVEIQDFISALDFKHLDWNNFLTPWIENFDDKNVFVFPYEPVVLHKKQVHELLNDVIKSKTLAAIQNVPEKNIGMSKTALEIMKEMAGVLDQDQKKTLRRVLQKN